MPDREATGPVTVDGLREALTAVGEFNDAQGNYNPAALAALHWGERAVAEIERLNNAMQRVRDLCNLANSMTGEPFDDIEDPTPIPGWTTLVLNALDGDDHA